MLYGPLLTRTLIGTLFCNSNFELVFEWFFNNLPHFRVGTRDVRVVQYFAYRVLKYKFVYNWFFIGVFHVEFASQNRYLANTAIFLVVQRLSYLEFSDISLKLFLIWALSCLDILEFVWFSNRRRTVTAFSSAVTFVPTIVFLLLLFLFGKYISCIPKKWISFVKKWSTLKSVFWKPVE